VRIGTGDEFLRSSGGTLTGALTISANADPMLTLHRPDGASARVMDFRLGGTLSYGLSLNPAEPKFAIQDGTFTERLQLNMATGLLGAALIPLSLLRVDEQTGKNAGAVTILAASTDIAFTAAMTVAVGDRIFVMANVQFTKGATGGLTTIYTYKQAGTSTLVWELDAPDAGQRETIVANDTPGMMLASIARVTGAGTLTLAVAGLSAGSNSTVAINGGQIHALQLRG
jgi:hypothetical protein